jgi:hypothetical protein
MSSGPVLKIIPTRPSPILLKIGTYAHTVLCELVGTSEGTLSPSPAMDTRKFRLAAERYLQV